MTNATATPESDSSPHLATRARPRISLSLTGEAAAVAEALAQEHHITEGEVVRRALAVLKFMNDEMARGTVFRMQSPNGESERLKIVYA